MVLPGGQTFQRVTSGVVAGAATLANALLPNLRAWHILNVDTGESVEGDYEAQDVNISSSADYARAYSLNRQDPITQYLHGNADRITFRARFRQSHAFDDAKKRFDKLNEWVRRDGDLRRPPIVLFWMGDGSINQQSVIDTIDAQLEPLTSTGAVRGIELTISLTKYLSFELESGPPPETRYHHARDGEYFELIAGDEYGDPMLGVIIRHRMAELQIIQAGDVVKLPSIEAIRREKAEPTSVPLQNLTSRKTSPQKTLRDFHLDRLNRQFTSTVVPSGL